MPGSDAGGEGGAPGLGMSARRRHACAAAAGRYASRVMPWLMQAPMNLVEFVVDRCPALDVLAVQLFDHLAGRLLSAVIRVMAGAEQELAAGRLVGAAA